TVRFVSQDDWQTTAYTYVYWDKDDDKDFDPRGGELLQKWLTTGREATYSYCSSIDYNDYSCVGEMISGHPKISCYRGYHEEGDYGDYFYTNYYHYWTEFEIDIEIPSEGVVTSGPNR